MLRSLLAILLFSLTVFTASAQDRAIGIVFDNSYSMRGNGQCEAVNYALQVIVGLTNPGDELYVNTMTLCRDVRQTEFDRMSEEEFKQRLCRYDNFLRDKEAAFETIQEIACTYANPFYAVDETMDELRQSRKKEKWLLFLTDGEWEDDMQKSDQRRLKNFIETTGAQVMFLNVDRNPRESKNNLDDALDDIADIKPLQTKGNISTIIDQMEVMGRQMMGIPKGGLKYEVEGNRVIIKTPIPLKRLIMLDQEKSSTGTFRKITRADVDGEVELKPSQNLYPKGDGISAWINSLEYTEGNYVIPAGTITIEFDDDISSRDIRFLPEAAAKLIAYPAGDIKSSSGSIYTVCDDVNQLKVEAKLVDMNNQPLANIDLKDCKVVVHSEGKNTEMTYQTTEKVFRAEIPLGGDETKFSVSAEYEGYFNYLSNLFTVRKDTCVKRVAGIETQNNVMRGVVDRLDEVQPIQVFPRIKDGPSGAFRSPTAEEFEDLYIEKTGGGRVKVKVEKEADHWLVRPSKNWCACFTATGKSEIELTMGSDNPSIKSDDSLTIVVEIEDIGWWDKCGWLVIAFLIFLVFLWYLVGLFKKPRFSKGSEVVYFRSTRTSKRRAISYGLPTNFVNRYFIPYLPEKRTVEGLTFIAGKRYSYILLDKDSQEENMYIGGSLIEEANLKDERVSMGEEVMIVRKKYREHYQYNLIN